MKIAIAGAGAMGCRFGSMLYAAGHEVTLLDKWREHVEAIQTKGLKVNSGDKNHLIKIPVSFPSDNFEEVELCIIFTKAMQTEDMIQSCLHLLGDQTWVLTLQNGLGNIEIIEQYVDKSRILAGVTTFASELIGPGEIQSLGSGDTQIMRVEGENSEEIRKIVRDMNDAGLNVELSSDVLSSIWSKVAFNAVLNPLCTITNSSVAAVGKSVDFQKMANQIIEEIILVAKSESINLQQEKIINMIKKAIDPQMSGHHLPSMLQDMQNGRKTEIDHLNGMIVSKGEKQGLSVPYNKLICHLIRAMEETREYRLVNN